MINILTSRFPLVGLALLLWLLPAAGHAFLGGFEEQDGYHSPVTTAGYLELSGRGVIPSLNIPGDATFYNGDPLNGFITWVPPSAFPNGVGDTTHGSDFTRYNAGQFGTNNGGPGGVAVDIRDDTGLWQVMTGGRTNEDAAAPNYNPQGRDHLIAWRYPNAHTGAQVLDLLAAEVDLSYDYSFDSRDFNGTAPGLTSSHQITMGFWFCPTDSDDGYGDNVFGLAMRDDAGQTLLEFGYTGTNFLQYRVGGSSLWQTTSVAAGTDGWSQVIMTVDTHTNSVSLAASAWDSGAGGLGAQNDFITGVGIGLDASALSKLRWNAEGGVLDVNSGSVADKNTFDTFEFNVVPVPEPGSAFLMALGGLMLLSRRRRK